MRDRVWIGSTRVHLFSMLLVWFRSVNIDEWAATDSTKNSNTQSTIRGHNAIPIYLFYRVLSVPFFKFRIWSLTKSVWNSPLSLDSIFLFFTERTLTGPVECGRWVYQKWIENSIWKRIVWTRTRFASMNFISRAFQNAVFRIFVNKTCIIYRSADLFSVKVHKYQINAWLDVT